MFVLEIGQETDIPLTGLLYAGRTCNDGSGVADDLATQQIRYRTGSDFHPFFLQKYSFSNKKFASSRVITKFAAI
jgi:hypothetical protein